MAVTIDTNPISSIMQASIVVQFTLIALIGMSVICWAIALIKFQQFRKIKKANPLFLARFWKTNSLDMLYEDLAQFKNSNVARVYGLAYVEMKKIADAAKKREDASLLSGSDNLERTMKNAVDVEIQNLESKLSLLATTGSTGPFIGLFGTVWGIMGSFHKIGVSGSASLAVVAPGISEALVATAIGLAAAIPAVMLYNNFITTIRRQEIELHNFSNDFLNIAKRNFFRE